jgi:RNA 2',3'-cyclic 3'-phosphodiesterase
VSAAGSVRLFVALPIPEHVRALVEAAAAPAREAHPELTWTRPRGWHLTLAFLGDVLVDRVGAVRDTVGTVVAGGEVGPVGCALAGAGRFGERALWLGVDDDPPGAIVAFGEAVQEALAAAHLPVQRRAVRPHLTLARASRRGAAVTDAVVRHVASVRGRWEVDDAELVRSHLGGGPARYETVASWRLGRRV